MRNLEALRHRVCIAAVIALVASVVEHSTPSAHAAPTPTTSKKPGKLPPDLPTKAEVISECTRAAYAELGKEIPAMRASHAGDKPGFARAYALRKEALVGAAALKKRGCAIARLE